MQEASILLELAVSLSCVWVDSEVVDLEQYFFELVSEEVSESLGRLHRVETD